ncbi:MAG: aspartate/glutamate racemase family protein, partial [Spirochaetales bacterium]|nr:aspartate/glutamate racemase family protein [Spirochaetales bacterium]
MKKIAVIPPIPLTETEFTRRRIQYEQFADRDFKIEIRSLKGGPLLTDSEYELLQAKGYMVAEAELAEKEGADAVIIDCTTDPGIVEMQQSLDIPVIGSLKSSLMLSLQTGRTFSILALDEIWAGMIKRKIEEYRLDKHLSSTEIIGTHVYNPENEREMDDYEYNRFLSQLFKAGEKAVNSGADTIILGSTTIIKGWKELENHLSVPVIAPGTAALKTAEIIL